jgi:hypothetical protein
MAIFNLTSAQIKVIDALKSGKPLTAYANFNRFVFNAGTIEGYTVLPKTVLPLIDKGFIVPEVIEFGHKLLLADTTPSEIKTTPVFTKMLNVYESNGKKVVLDGSAGDKFGYVKDIETGDVWSTYGYPQSLKQVGTVKFEYSYSSFSPI